MFDTIISQWNVGGTWNRLPVKFHSGNAAGNAAGIFHTDFVRRRMISKIEWNNSAMSEECTGQC